MVLLVIDTAAYTSIKGALDAIPAALLARSGSIMYTGRAAFSEPSNLYIVGLNPGGDPIAQAAETVGAHRAQFLTGPALWSAYADERWCGALPGTWGLQPRVLHMLAALGLDAQRVPASNVVFARSTTEAALTSNKAELLRMCWPVHDAVTSALKVRVIACFGGTAGRWIRDLLGAHQRVDAFEEKNARRWTSETHQAGDGRLVVTLTHPGRANWLNPSSDPTPLVQRALAHAGRG